MDKKEENKVVEIQTKGLRKIQWQRETESVRCHERNTLYTEIEIERGDEAWDTKKETKEEAESNHWKKSMAHQHW